MTCASEKIGAAIVRSENCTFNPSIWSWRYIDKTAIDVSTRAVLNLKSTGKNANMTALIVEYWIFVCIFVQLCNISILS